MNRIFGRLPASSNEECKKVLKRRMWLLLLFAMVGLVTVIITVIAEQYGKAPINDHTFGFFCGAGTGMFAAGMIWWLKSKLLLKNEEKLKRKRLLDNDERILTISHRAFRAAAVGLLAALYLIMFVAEFFIPELSVLMACLIYLFLIVYYIAYKVLERQM